MFNKKTLLSLIALSSLALAACDSNDEMIDDQDTSTPAVEETESDSTVDEDKNQVDNDYANIKIMPEELFDIFLDKYPNAKVNQIELDEEVSGFVYNLEGFDEDTEYELKINSIDGSIIKESTETDNDIDEIEITREQVAKVVDLVDIALSEAGEGARLEEWIIEEDDGIVQLEIEIDNDGFGDQERIYNVETGELIELDD